MPCAANETLKSYPVDYERNNTVKDTRLKEKKNRPRNNSEIVYSFASFCFLLLLKKIVDHHEANKTQQEIHVHIICSTHI